MAPLKRKGDLAELKVAADLSSRGCAISFPFGEDCDYDIVADFKGVLHRVQVKYTESDGQMILVRCRSHSLTKGKVRRTKYYTAETVDWIAVYDRTSDRCYYLPSSELGSGRCDATLRITPARNGQRVGIRYARDHMDPDFSRDPRVEPAGLEPAASAVQGRRSSS
jgi:Holliday junction resolvase-like predicted endonuclease